MVCEEEGTFTDITPTLDIKLDALRRSVETAG